MSDIRTFDQIDKADAAAVGGKGLSLGLLAAAGLPVPPGFCVASSAHRRLRGKSPAADAALAEQLRDAYRRLGGGAVAVRSSATAEDGAVVSFAGQQETFLGVRGEDDVLDAVGRCWESLDSERAVAYRRKQGVDEQGLAMAVVVQRLVPSEVSGVLFTKDPLDRSGRSMLVEASWGLGESVVSGRVTPDRFHLDRQTGAVIDRHINTKPTELTPDGLRPVPTEKQDQPCLSDAQLAELAELGRKVEAFYGDARDVEWAWAEGKFWLLQARPITTGGAAEHEQVRAEEVAALRERARPEGTVWARFNLAEVLPEPTPMTWAIVKKFMSGRGGFGLLYQDLGYQPDPKLADDGAYDLICGRPYCNLSREPLFYARGQPLEHDFAALKAAPHLAVSYPQPKLNRKKLPWYSWLLAPVDFVNSMKFETSLQNWSRTFAERLRQQIIPAFVADTEQAAARDLSGLSPTELLAELDRWVQKTLVDFARESLKPTVLAASSLGKLEWMLTGSLGPERAKAAIGELALGVRPDPEADLPRTVQDLAAGRMPRELFLQRFGHRGNQEMELSQPRWREDHAALDRLVGKAGSSHAAVTAHDAPPLKETWEKIAAEAKLQRWQRVPLEGELQAAHTYLGLRETGKHYLMRGYALIRRALVELDRRFRLNGGVFYLTPEELPRLVGGEDLSGVIAQRRRRRAVALSLEVPQVLFSDDLDAIGRPIEVAGADVLHGVPLSAGVTEAPALVLETPGGEVPDEPYVLVCPSTDPAWVPLFVHAKGLVMETGGVLSHGAIVAREFGLPAVAGIPDVHRRLRTGQRLRVDGGGGSVSVLP